jgi:hypothetical protein
MRVPGRPGEIAPIRGADRRHTEGIALDRCVGAQSRRTALAIDTRQAGPQCQKHRQREADNEEQQCGDDAAQRAHVSPLRL